MTKKELEKRVEQLEQDINILKMQIEILRQPIIYPIYPQTIEPTVPIRSPFWCENT
jgi:regulator of replication initiation timing